MSAHRIHIYKHGKRGQHAPARTDTHQRTHTDTRRHTQTHRHILHRVLLIMIINDTNVHSYIINLLKIFPRMQLGASLKIIPRAAAPSPPPPPSNRLREKIRRYVWPISPRRSTDWRTDGQTNGRTDERTDEVTDGRTDEVMDGRSKGRTKWRTGSRSTM